MKFIQKLANERFARPAAQLMKFACYFVICFYVLCTVLSFMGRQSFFLHTKTGTYERAIYAEENHAAHSRSITVFMGDDIHVWTNDNDQIDLTIQIGLSLMYAVHIVPMIFAYWFLSRVFSNINKGQIFTEKNSSYLLYYGMLQFSVAVFVPFIKLLICWLTNLISNGRMSISTGQAMFNMLIPSIAFIVAAYIIHYGVHLQDEVDHTL
ncbi:DUF2975 domain-containing protein [Flintibacter muris]|uniref:DUF2975 domain-containing protein n=1 Tax=Flintibacter muris TaxID=2941327 RepID=UPI00203FBFE0|nr:DUF2975 domain-containing protein [Flintibacter muris]